MNQKPQDAVELLITQHRAMEDLLKEVKDVEDHERRQQLFAEAGDLLTVHIKSEEEIFYPAVKAERTEDDLREELEEHLSLKRLLADLLELDATDKTFEAKLKVLTEQAEHHHQEEEEQLFPEVCRLLGRARREQLGREMWALQAELKKRGEPRETIVNETDAAAPLQ